MSFFSVVVPVFNAETYLRKCIKSILDQSCKDFELVLIDDGSSDNSLGICEEYTKVDSRVHTIHQENSGVSSARNVGIEYVTNNLKSDYILFVDADDYISESLLSYCKSVIDEYGVDWIIYKMIVIKDDNFFFNNGTLESKVIDIKNNGQFLLGNITNPDIGFEIFTRLYKRSVIEKNRIRFPDGHNCAEDLFFNACYSLFATRLFISNRPLYYYRVTNESLSHNNNTPKLNEMNYLSHELYKRMEQLSLTDNYFLIHHKIMKNRFRFLPLLDKAKNISIWDKELKTICDYSFCQKHYKVYLRYALQGHLFRRFSTEYNTFCFLAKRNKILTFFQIMAHSFLRHS